MKRFSAVLALAVILGVGFAEAKALKDSPIDKVIVLIKELQSKIEADGKDEQASYDNYACWVESTLQRKAKDISEAKELLEELDKSIVKLKADIASHEAEIAQLQKDIAQNEEAIKEAKAVRDKEYAEYAQEKTESEQCIGALEQAIKVLTGAGTKKAFLQQAQLMSIAGGVRRVMQYHGSRSMVSDSDFKVVKHFLERPDDFAAPTSGIIATQTGQNPFGDYAPQSTQIQGILKGMYDAFTAELEKDNVEEANKQKAFEEIFGTKMQELKTLKVTLQKQETDSAKKTKQLAADEALREDTTESLAADEKFFEETKDAAETKATVWSNRTRLRVEELAGMQGAVQILSSGTETFDNATYTLVELKVVHKHADTHEQAYNKLRNLASKYHSLNMQQIMTAVKMGGHFDKVMIMIDQMMALLRKEEQEDIEHRDRCQNSESANKNSIEDEKHAIEKDKSNLERMANSEEDLRKELVHIEEEINATKGDMQEMLDQRNKEHAEFVFALKMDADAIELIKMAVAKISKYYKENNIPVKLMQQPQYSEDPDKAPDTTFSSADSHQGETHGIVSILEMIMEDLQKEMAEGRADDAKAQAEYEKQSGALQDSLDAQRETKVSLEKELAELEDSISGAEKRKAEKEADLESEEDMKKALYADCSWVKTHFETRREKRKTEMAGLVEAKDFLAGVEAGDAVLAP